MSQETSNTSNPEIEDSSCDECEMLDWYQERKDRIDLMLPMGEQWNSDIHRRSLRWQGKNLWHRNKFRELGLWFDYPTCCIDAFLYRCDRGEGWRDAPSVVRLALDLQWERKEKNGYVPCCECARNYLATKK